MTDQPIEAALRTLGIPVQAEWLPSIRFHLELSLRLAALVAEFPLADEADSAPVFRA